MSCTECRAYLLEAARDEIERALGGSAAVHTQHLAGCRDCRALAERIVASEAALAQAMSVLRPRGQVGQAAVSAASESERRRRVARRRLSWLAAAAALAGLLAIRTAEVSNGPELEPVTRLIPAADPAPLGLEVESLGGESVAVFETRDPDVVVLWFYEGRGE